MDVLLVRKDAPVQRMRLGPWLLYVFLLLMVLILASIAGGGYLLYRQNLALSDMVKDNRRLRLAAQNLESLVRDLQDRTVLSSVPKELPPPPPRPPQAPPEPPKAVPPPPPPPPAKAQSSSAAEAPAKDNDAASASPAAQALEPWPTSSDWVDVRGIKYKKSGREMLVYFDIANKGDPKSTASGFITVLLRSHRQGTPWVESWPPTRLTPLGRPENPKKGAAFSVQRYRRLRARFALVDQKVDAVEFLVYDKEGELALLVRESMGAKKSDG